MSMFVLVLLFSSVWCHCSGWRDPCVTAPVLLLAKPEIPAAPGAQPLQGHSSQPWRLSQGCARSLGLQERGHSWRCLSWWGFAAYEGSRCGSDGVCDQSPMSHWCFPNGQLQTGVTVIPRAAVWSCVNNLWGAGGASVTEGSAAPSVPLWFLGAGEGGKHLNKECLWKWPLVILAHSSSKAAIVFLLVKQQSSSRWGFFLSPCSIMLAFMCPPGPHPAVWWASTQMYCSGSHIPGRSNAPAPHQLHICNC